MFVALAAAVAATAAVAIKGKGVSNVPSRGGADIVLAPGDRANHPYIGFSSFAWRAPDGVSPVAFVNLLTNAGATIVRDTLDWEALEPERGHYDERQWSRYTDMYKRLKKAGITPLWTLQNAPSWATIQSSVVPLGQPNCHKSFGCLSDPPAGSFIPDFAKFATEAAKRMPTAQFEVWNEPNLTFSWEPYGIDPAYYTRMQCAVYKAVKAKHPNTVITSGGINGTFVGDATAMPAKDFLRVAYDNGLNECMDDLSVHVYPLSDGFGDRSYWGQAWAQIIAARSAAGDTHPVYESEVGIATGGDKSVSEDEQATIIKEAYARLLAFRKTSGYPPINAVIIHTLRDYTLPGNNSPSNPEPHYGLLLDTPGSRPKPKPAFCWLVSRAHHTYPGC